MCVCRYIFIIFPVEIKEQRCTASVFKYLTIF